LLSSIIKNYYIELFLFRADKCVTVNEDEQIYYDYLFLFYGEQFGYTAEENETKNSIE
jgi:hypothetical protein